MARWLGEVKASAIAIGEADAAKPRLPTCTCKVSSPWPYRRLARRRPQALAAYHWQGPD